jgi:peptidoglycan hydrolase-like protein with peptidoglycan-binding domain
MNNGPTLRLGLTGSDVRRLQRVLVQIKLLDFTRINGSFTAETERAVTAFQQGNGLTVDGVVGPHTWSALPADPNTPELAQGSAGPAVLALQRGLKT